MSPSLIGLGALALIAAPVLLGWAVLSLEAWLRDQQVHKNKEK